MYYSNTFEAAMIICGYHLYRLFYTDRARYIRKAEGFIRIRSKRVIDGKVKRVKRQIRVRWDVPVSVFVPVITSVFRSMICLSRLFRIKDTI